MFINDKRFDIRNYMEDCVEDNVDKVIRSCGGCNCDLCKIDTMAIALNNLPPKYIVTQKGHVYSKLSILQQQFDADVVAALVKAIDIVKQNPRHEVFENNN